MRLVDKAVEDCYGEMLNLYNEGRLGPDVIKKVIKHHFYKLYCTAFSISYNVWKKANKKN